MKKNKNTYLSTPLLFMSQNGFHVTKSEVAVDRKQDGEMKWTASAGAGVNLPLTGWNGEK